MYQVDSATAATTLPAPAAVGPNPGGFFTSGSPGVVAATVVDQDIMNAMMMELANAVLSSGQTLSKTNQSQLAAALKGRLLNVQTFLSSGTYTPTPGTTKIEAFVYGAGAAAGGAPLTGANLDSCGSGGGSGAFSYLYLTSGITSQSVTVGAAGTGVSGGNGNAGGASSFGALAMANGGGGGLTAGPSGTATTFLAGGGAGGTVGSTGTLKAAGSVGGSAIVINGTGFVLPAAVGSWQAGFGAGGPGNGNSQSSAAQTGASGQPGLVIVREYA